MPSRAPRKAFFALLAAALSLSAQAEVQLLPAGEFAARDGRPGTGKTWSITDAAGRKLAADLSASAAQSAFVFDIDHQTIRAEANGQPAPAAGWATKFEWRAGVGLFATDVRWTEQAQGWIESGAYRYVSPVITFAPGDGRITGVLMAAITNYPALMGMEPLGQALTAQLSAQFPDTVTDPQEHDVTTLAALIAKLGLKADTTEAEALQAVVDLQARAAQPAALSGQLVNALGLKAGTPEATEAAALAAITTLQTQARGTDATTATMITSLQGQVATLTAQAAERQVAEVVQAALSAGKLLPAQREWAEGLGRKDLASLQAYVASAPTVASLQSQTGGRTPAGANDAGMTAEALAGKARAYQAEQLAAGVEITTAQAVMHVNKGPAPAAA